MLVLLELWFSFYYWRVRWTHSILVSGTQDDFWGSVDYQRRKSLHRNSIQYSKMRLYFKGRLLCSELLCRNEVWGEVSGLWWEKRSRRGQGSCWTAGETQRTSVGTPDCKQGHKLIPSRKLTATWDCWLSEVAEAAGRNCCTPKAKPVFVQGSRFARAWVLPPLQSRVTLVLMGWGHVSRFTSASPTQCTQTNTLLEVCCHLRGGGEVCTLDTVFPLQPPGLTLIAAHQFLEKRFQEKSRVP